MKLLALGLIPLLAGCVAPATPAPPGPAPTYAAQLAAGLPQVTWDVGEAVDWWEDAATNYPKHDAHLPANAQLRQHLVNSLAALGYQVEVRAYPGAVEGQDVPTGEVAPVYAVVATKPGLRFPDHRIGLVSHYDSSTTTVHGAYDDMAGVAAEYALCKALAKVPMDRTLACIFFDSEELGLVASKRYVDDVVKGGTAGYVYDFVLGYDMVGINWPATYNGQPWSLYVMVGENFVPELFGFTRDLLHGARGYPSPAVTVLDRHDRNSDERRFKEAGIPILRFAGGRHAADYDQYHLPLDTVEHVYAVTGGRANFERGFATVVDASLPAILALDRTSLAELRAHAG